MKHLATRLRTLEADFRAHWQRRVEQMTDADLDAIIAAHPVSPELEAAIQALSDADLEQAARGELDAAAVLRRYREGHIWQAVAPYGTES